ncbi:MAG: hypothetical protein M1818_005537 [Claussenomyces sp. TS43310]|nr:MAG: hypothetical protein M1818_005537 [Claussenomyces sp. TS43310]
MFPASQGLNLDIQAISGICGSISIACWIVVFSPQIIENFRRSSADGLSLQFIIVWLVGDVFNILGAVLQGVLPTMLILAVYYTLADMALLGQCFYYRGFTWRDDVPAPKKPGVEADQPSERTALIQSNDRLAILERRSSNWSNIDATHLSPVTPLIDARSALEVPAPAKKVSRLQVVLMNLFVVLMVCAAGVLGWWLSNSSQPGPHHGHRDDEKTPQDDDHALRLNVVGQVFGYLCALLYLGSRVPQLLLNYRRKSTEGISILFFLFACIGNLTYVLSIFAYEPHCPGRHGECRSGDSGRIYARYILVNASWIAGSLGTLFLDFAIFVQFFLYQSGDATSLEEEAVNWNGQRSLRHQDDRPLLERGDSTFSRT